MPWARRNGIFRQVESLILQRFWVLCKNHFAGRQSLQLSFFILSIWLFFHSFAYFQFLVIVILKIKSEDDMQGDTFFILERSKVIGFVQKMSSVSRYIGYVVIELYTLECQLNFTVQEIKPDWKIILTVFDYLCYTLGI